MNPTGSFKDRGMTVAVSHAKAEGAEAVICASTGNTAASAAAYAARAGMRGAVIVPEGKIARGKLAQALMHGARVISLRGNFDQALELVKEIVERHPVELVNSINPYRIEGQKTAAFEVCDELGAAPARARDPGRQRRQHHRLVEGVRGVRAGAPAPATASRPRARRRSCAARSSSSPETVASAIRIGNPARWQEAVAALEQSGGRIAAVTDDEILEAQRWLAANEGVFCEPASAASVAGALEARGARASARLRAHRPRPQGPGHRDRERARRGRLRRRACGGRAAPCWATRRLMGRRRNVRVPASSANLGPGFDALAAAVSLHMELEVEETGEFSVDGRRPAPARPTSATSA